MGKRKLFFKYIVEGRNGTDENRTGSATDRLTISNIRFYEKKGLLEPERNQTSKIPPNTVNRIQAVKADHFISEMSQIEKIALMLDDPAGELVRQQLQS